MVIMLNPLKKINNKGEKRFAEIMTSKGFNLLHQPFIKDNTTKYKRHHFDFFCLETGIFYEVIATSDAYYNTEAEINSFIEDGYPVHVVTPEGEPYVYQNRNWRWQGLQLNVFELNANFHEREIS